MRVLGVYAFMVLSLVSAQGAFADNIPLPTLDELHQEGTTIPDTDPPVVYPESAYTYTPTDAPGVNTVTRYEWSDTENKLVPKYYTVTLKQTEYGYKDAGGETKTFTVQTPSSDGTTDAFSYTINYYTDPSRLASDRITTDQNGADIDNDFVGMATIYDYGGAIDNGGAIGSITGNFIANYIKTTGASPTNTPRTDGGAIYNSGTIGNITGDFIGNYASVATDWADVYNREAYGGAIYNHAYSNRTATIGDIRGNFVGNYAYSSISEPNSHLTGTYSIISSGGAIYNHANNNGTATIGDIAGNFVGNYASAISYSANHTASAAGGAIANEGAIGNITGDFIGNYATAFADSSKASDSRASGGAIANLIGTIGDIKGDFIGNYVSTSGTNTYAYGGAIYNYYGTISNITGDFIGNYVSASGANALALGGAIANIDTIGTKDEQTGTITGGIINSSFINNKAEAPNGTALGGAIFSYSGLNITADNGQSIFSGNKTISNGVEEQNAIAIYGYYISDAGIMNPSMSGMSGFINMAAETEDELFSDKNPASLTLDAKNNGVIIFDDTIKGGGIDYRSGNER